MRAAARLGAVGTELAIFTIGGLLLGSWLDGRFATEPWLALGGLVLGAALGFRTMIAAVRQSEASTKGKK